jgi:hypothetical protein
VETQKQRRSLRQMLLSSGYITLYQMAMIEAGNLDGLVLGPVRVMDRLRVTAHEAVYRVFDPRRRVVAGASNVVTGSSNVVAGSPDPATESVAGSGDRATTRGEGGYAILRHLAEEEMQIPSHAEGFRQGFTAAGAISHPNLAATWEVLDISSRPAVLQEWLTGLPSTDWPSMATAPGVWFRLLRQAAQGLQAAHEAGLVHGHLDAGRILLTAEGILKIAGFGEPAWLISSQKAESRRQTADGRNEGSGVRDQESEEGIAPSSEVETIGRDLDALTRIAIGWIAPPTKKKGTRAKAMPKPLRGILDRLKSEDPATRYPNVATLLEDLNQISEAVPDNSETWDKLLSQVREQGNDEVPLQQSA